LLPAGDVFHRCWYFLSIKGKKKGGATPLSRRVGTSLPNNTKGRCINVTAFISGAIEILLPDHNMEYFIFCCGMQREQVHAIGNIVIDTHLPVYNSGSCNQVIPIYYMAQHIRDLQCYISISKCTQ